MADTTEELSVSIAAADVILAAWDRLPSITARATDAYAAVKALADHPDLLRRLARIAEDR